MKNIINAFKQYIPAFKLISKHNLWGWVLLPGLVFLLVAIPTYMLITGWLGNFGLNQVTVDKNMNAILYWLLTALIKIGKAVSFIAGFFIFLYTYKFIYLIVCSPVLGLLSEKAEERMLGTNYPFTTKQLLIDIKRGIFISLRNALRQFLLLIVLLPLSFIPVVGFIFSFILILIDCYYYGFSFLDYNSERHKLKYRESVKLISNNRGFAIGIGAGLLLILLIPIVGWIIGPGLATVAAMLTYLNFIKPIAKK